MKKRTIFGVFLALILITPSVLKAAPVPGPTATAPVSNEQARRSDDLGQSSTATEVDSYEQLVTAIRQARAASQGRVEQAVQQEKVREAWETGKLIDEYVLQHKERADYADQTIIRLARDLGTSETELRYMLQFARTYPIHRPADELSWSHYESLMAVNDLDERKALAKKAVKEKWTRDQVREEVQKRKAARNEMQVPGKEIPLTAKPGRPGTYKMVKATVGPETGKVMIDLGFSNYYKTSKDLRFKEGFIIETISAVPGGGSSPSDLIRPSKRTSEDLYTYRAWVVDILDGDTLKVVVDLGFGVRSVQTIRLRGIDCPEIVSKEGKEAKAFVETLLKGVEYLTIKTIKSDKYDRYLADVMVPRKDGSYLYLNNALIEEGHAVRVRE